MKRCAIFLASFLGIISAGGIAGAQTSYQQTNLVSDTAGSAAHTDHMLLNPWGIAFKPGGPFWIANNASGFATVYDSSGATQLPISVAIPAPNIQTPANPTGVVFSPFADAGDFSVDGSGSQFLFATEDGTVAGWYIDSRGDFPAAAVVAIDNSNAAAVYKSLAILAPSCCREFLAVANFHSGLIEAYTVSFDPLAPPGSFTDPNLPPGYAPFGMQVIGTQLFVTYALQDAAKHDPVTGAGDGIVDVFDLEGNFVRRFVSNGPLDAPWGVTQASGNFGAFSNAILVGNFGDGHINAFDPDSGTFLGTLQDPAGNAITNPGLWGLTFGSSGTPDSDNLYFSAGLSGETHGVFGKIATAPSGTPDFEITPPTSSGTISAGGTATFTLTMTPAGGFSGTVTFSCTLPAGATCAFDPPSISGTSTAATILTVDTSGLAAARGQTSGMISATVLIGGLGLFGGVVLGGGQRRRQLSRSVPTFVLTGLIAGTMLCAGCGGYRQNSQRPKTGAVSIIVNATSGSLVHTATIDLTLK